MESRCNSRMKDAGNLRGDRCHGYEHPSFSSTLLDSIYRSFDDSSHDLRPSSRSRSQSLLRRDDEKQYGNQIGGNSTTVMMMMKSSSASMERRSRGCDVQERKSRGRVVDRWMEKTSRVDEDLVIRRRSLPPETTTGLRTSAMTSDHRRSLGSVKVHSSPVSSSDSSSGGRFSSYDGDYFSAKKKKQSLKPIRTSVSDLRSETFQTSLSEEFLYRKNPSVDSRPPKSDSAGKSAKSRAMKLYGDLKRMKQPISPGGKLANFLNSLFSATGGSKKQRISSSPSSASNFTTNTTPSCSTASSYSRSCLSKRPSSASRYDCGVPSVKRSVRFCPVSVIVDEDLQPCGHKSLGGSEDTEQLKLRTIENNRRVEQMARDLLRNYHEKRESAPRKDLNNISVSEMEKSRDQNMVVADNDDDCDDVESCCSSDLFELEIGVDRFCEELPVYETTRVDTNRAIASGRMT